MQGMGEGWRMNGWRMERINEGENDWINKGGMSEGWREWVRDGENEWGMERMSEGWREWMKDGQNELRLDRMNEGRMERMNDVPTFLSTGVLGGCCVTVGGNNPLSWEPVDMRGFGVFTAAVTVAFPPGNNNCNSENNKIRSTSKWRTLENFGINLNQTSKRSMDQRYLWAPWKYWQNVIRHAVNTGPLAHCHLIWPPRYLIWHSSGIDLALLSSRTCLSGLP